jgi:urate oxidase
MSEFINTIPEIDSKIKELELIKTDDGGWVTYYIDEKTSEKWIKDYPNSSYHGGGVPTLTKVEKFPWE